VKADLQPEEASTIAWENLAEEEIEQVAAIWARSNRFLPKRNYAGPARQGCPNDTRNPNISWGYCQKKNGHMQKECNSH
jgi:hypothetical protein